MCASALCTICMRRISTAAPQILSRYFSAYAVMIHQLCLPSAIEHKLPVSTVCVQLTSSTAALFLTQPAWTHVTNGELKYLSLAQCVVLTWVAFSDAFMVGTIDYMHASILQSFYLPCNGHQEHCNALCRTCLLEPGSKQTLQLIRCRIHFRLFMVLLRWAKGRNPRRVSSREKGSLTKMGVRLLMA